MKKIDGQGEPFLPVKEPVKTPEERAARLQVETERACAVRSGMDRVILSGKKDAALLADVEMMSRLKKEGRLAAGQEGSPLDRYTAGFETSNSYARETFRKCLPNTMNTTVSLKDDDTTFTITGDIPAMWVRDSCAQIHPYVYMCRDNPELQRVVRGTILRHVKNFNSPEADAPFINSWKDDYTPWEKKYEPDGIAYLIRLASLYTATTGDVSWAQKSGDFDARRAFDKALDLIKQKSGPEGLVACPNRPSDDWTQYPYLIPTNMFLAAQLPRLKDMYQKIWNDPVRAKECEVLEKSIRSGIERYGKVNHEKYGTIWAYEVDGKGNANLMDDANVPSLLSAPYLEFCSPSDPVYRNTRKFVLSPDNPYYSSGALGEGVGSPHTPGKRIWPMSLIMRALTSEDTGEIRTQLSSLDRLDAGTHYMHEGVNPDNPNEYSRGWFSWANSLYSEMVLKKVLGLNYIPGEGTYIKPNLNPEWNRVELSNSVPFGDVSSLKLKVSGEGSEIVSATVNGKTVPIDPEMGIRIQEKVADVVIQTRSS